MNILYSVLVFLMSTLFCVSKLSKDTTVANLTEFAEYIRAIANDGSNVNPAKVRK